MIVEANVATTSEPTVIDLPTTKIVAEIEGGVGWLTYNNPQRRNALSLEMQEASAAVLRRFQEDDAVRVVVLRGAGDRAFVSGADISEFEKLRTTVEARERYDRAGRETGRAFAALEKPLVAMIRGYCLGGGHRTQRRPADRLGGFDLRDTRRPPRSRLRVCRDQGAGRPGGPSRTSEILLTARRFNAAEALHMGLIDRVTTAEELESTVRDLAGRMAENAPLTLRAAKFAIRQATKDPERRDLDRAKQLVEECFRSEDYVEGRRAFLEKRRPRFRGRGTPRRAAAPNRLRAERHERSTDLCLDVDRVFASGYSNGGMFVHRLGCALGDRLAAVAPMHGYLASGFNCAAGEAGPSMLLIGGSSDRTVPIDGSHASDGYIYTSQQGVAEKWAGAQSYATEPVPVETPWDGRKELTCVEYPNCAGGRAVRSCSWDGAHVWPRDDAGNFGGELLWRFFSEASR